jgi:hypothetical protein
VRFAHPVAHATLLIGHVRERPTGAPPGAHCSWTSDRHRIRQLTAVGRQAEGSSQTAPNMEGPRSWSWGHP